MAGGSGSASWRSASWRARSRSPRWNAATAAASVTWSDIDLLREPGAMPCCSSIAKALKFQAPGMLSSARSSVAAVRVQDLRRHVARILAGEEQEGRRHLVRLAGTAHRGRLAELGDLLWLLP